MRANLVELRLLWVGFGFCLLRHLQCLCTECMDESVEKLHPWSKKAEKDAEERRWAHLYIYFLRKQSTTNYNAIVLCSWFCSSNKIVRPSVDSSTIIDWLINRPIQPSTLDRNPDFFKRPIKTIPHAFWLSTKTIQTMQHFITANKLSKYAKQVHNHSKLRWQFVQMAQNGTEIAMRTQNFERGNQQNGSLPRCAAKQKDCQNQYQMHV